jgi:hypothetical protein
MVAHSRWSVPSAALALAGALVLAPLAARAQSVSPSDHDRRA